MNIKIDCKDKTEYIKKILEYYDEMDTDYLKDMLDSIVSYKSTHENILNEYKKSNRIYPGIIESMKELVKMCDDHILVIKTILNHRMLRDKIGRYKNLTIEELDTLYGSLIFTLSFLSEDKYNNELKAIEKVLNMKRDE